MSPVSHIEDRWFRTATGANGKPVKEPRPRNGVGLRYRVRYQDPDRKEHSESFAKKADADAFKTRIDADLLRGTYRDPDAGRISLRKYGDEWLAAQAFDAVTREAVESQLRIHVYPALGSLRLDELAARPSLVKTWLSGLSLAPSTAGKVLTHLNSIMIAAVLDGRIVVNPCSARTVRAPRDTRRRPEIWTNAQVAGVRAALPERIAAMVDAGTGLGLRQSEIFGLSVEEIDFLRRVVHVRHQVKLVGGRPFFALPKGEKERHVPLATQTGQALAAHIAGFPPVTVTLPWHDPKNRRHGQPHSARLLFTTRAGQAAAPQRVQREHVAAGGRSGRSS